jgi:adhesin/invasin
MTIAEGEYTRLRQIHLLLTAPDDTVQMYLDGDLQDAPNVRQWVAYTPTVTVTLADDDGSKTVRVQYRDVADNVGEWAGAQIVYDATPPVIADLSPADGSTTTTATPVISATVRDETAGIDPQSITMTVDCVLVNPVYNGSTVSWTPDPPLTNISHTVTLLALDRAGNTISTTWAFAVDEPPAHVSLTASPSVIVADGISTATVTATVTDQYDNPVADGTEVVFTTTLGTFSGDTVYTTTTQSGLAVAVLTAPTTDGVARITARAGSVEGSVEVRLIRYRVYLPLVLRSSGP